MYVINYPHLKGKNNTGWMESSRNIRCFDRRFAWILWGFIDPFCNLDPFDEGEMGCNITSVINCASEKNVEMMMIIKMNSYPGLLKVMAQQKKKMTKRLRKTKSNLM